MNEPLESALCAYVDILGFREQIEKAYSDKTEYALFQSISSTFAASSARIRSAADHLAMRLKVKFFTDSLVVAYSVMNPIIDLAHLCELLADYQLSMALNNGVFLRGGISLGTVAIDEGMIIGDCFLQAHDLEKKWAVSPRIIVDSRIKELIANERPRSDKTWQNTLDLRLLRDCDGEIFVNYLNALYQPPSWNSMQLAVNEEQLSKHRTVVSRCLEAQSKLEVWFKYFWAGNCHNHFCDGNKQQRHKIPENLLLPKPAYLTPS